jgi:hypothetical protein
VSEKAKRAVLADDQMVEHLDVEGFSSSAEPFGEENVAGRRLRVAARVVVRDDDGTRPRSDGRPKHLARVDGAAVNGTNGHTPVMQNCVARPKIQHMHFFARKPFEVGLEVSDDGFGSSGSRSRLRLTCSPTQLEGREQSACGWLAQPTVVCQPVRAEAISMEPVISNRPSLRSSNDL